MLIEKIEALKKSRIKVSAPSSNWASMIGDPCERKLVYARTCPEKKPLGQNERPPNWNGLFLDRFKGCR